MVETINPAPKNENEVVRIPAAQNEKDQTAMGLPPGMAQFAPGGKWLGEHGGLVTGHIEEETGDIVIDEHTPRV